MKKLCTWVLTVGICMTALAGSAVAADWTPLGDRILNYRSDQGDIAVKNDGAFRQIKFQVFKNAVEIKNVTVTFKDGSTFDAAVDAYVAPGKSTKEIDLPGAKAIDKVSFTFRKPGSAEYLATVRLLATE